MKKEMLILIESLKRDLANLRAEEVLSYEEYLDMHGKLSDLRAKVSSIITMMTEADLDAMAAEDAKQATEIVRDEQLRPNDWEVA
jgi:hypothetical protein